MFTSSSDPNRVIGIIGKRNRYTRHHDRSDRAISVDGERARYRHLRSGAGRGGHFDSDDLGAGFSADRNADVLDQLSYSGQPIGTYQIGTTSTTANLMDANGTTYQASGANGSGTITVDSFSAATRTASGTFNLFVVQNGTATTKAVSGGTYNVTF
jgi:hypothetical protein